MKLSALFAECLSAPYIHVENAGDYWLKPRGNTLYIYLECSSGLIDWKNNLDFLPATHQSAWKDLCCEIDICKGSCALPTLPYREMERRWLAHRGFLRVWKSIEPYITNAVCDKHYQKMVIVGYSHGAALAVFCHEHVWFHRPELRKRIEGYGFGCPRVFWSLPNPKSKIPWEHFTVIRNLNDIVTHVPPSWLGFSHVGNMLSIGQRGKYSAIDAHRPENIMTELQILERK